MHCARLCKGRPELTERKRGRRWLYGFIWGSKADAARRRYCGRRRRAVEPASRSPMCRIVRARLELSVRQKALALVEFLGVDLAAGKPLLENVESLVVIVC